MAVRRVRLERTWRRAACAMAARPSRGIHRCDRIVLRDRVRQRDRVNDSAAFVCGGPNASNATALGPKLHDAGNCRAAPVWLARRSKSFAGKTSPRRGGAGKYSAEPKIRFTIHPQNLRSIRALERYRAARKSAARFVGLA